MVDDFSLLVIPQIVHVGVEEDQHEGVEEIKEEPDVYHLHVGGFGQDVTYFD